MSSPDQPAPTPEEVNNAETADRSTRPSRRTFLGIAGVGAGAAAVGLTPGVAGAVTGRRGPDGDGKRDHQGDGRKRDGQGDRGHDGRRGLQQGAADGPDRFTRLFDRNELDGRAADEMREALIEVSRPGGVLDANDPLEVGPIRLITEPELSPNNLDNPTITAGNTFVGQFLDHDITRDAGSRLGRPDSLQRSTNLRTARFDLDSVYGGGPSETPDLYEDDLRFVVESGGLFEDLPRDASGMAIIADPRNDENLIISGLHAGFLLFHNAVLDRVEASGLQNRIAFDEAQRIVRWHYQWMILHEYLPAIVGADLVNDIGQNDRRIYTPDRPTIPVEFQTSAFRFGHSQVRPSYRANLAKNNKSINPKISTPLFRLPMMAIPSARGEDVGPTSLATRNLLRHLTWEIATGQEVARQMGEAPLTPADLSIFGDFGANLEIQTPLWLYVLQEAELVSGGQTLGPVGGRIVAEVFIGLLEMDTNSYLRAEPDWRPTLPSRSGDDDFGMADLLTVAGVDPSSRGQ